MTESVAGSVVDSTLFQNLQLKIDEDSQLRQEIRDHVQNLEKQR